jgi:hypothetical protein
MKKPDNSFRTFLWTNLLDVYDCLCSGSEQESFFNKFLNVDNYMLHFKALIYLNPRFFFY